MINNIINMTNQYITLTDAIARIRKANPWLPETSLREAVRKGLVPHRRASQHKKARYFVRMQDLQRYVNTLIVSQPLDAA